MRDFNDIEKEFYDAGYVLHSDFFIVSDTARAEDGIAFKFSKRNSIASIIGIVGNCVARECTLNLVIKRMPGILYPANIYSMEYFTANRYTYKFNQHVLYDNNFIKLIPQIIKFLNNVYSTGNSKGII